jgi:hypothetical protein
VVASNTCRYFKTVFANFADSSGNPGNSASSGTSAAVDQADR